MLGEKGLGRDGPVPVSGCELHQLPAGDEDIKMVLKTLGLGAAEVAAWEGGVLGS
jgi:hypothetical protein